MTDDDPGDREHVEADDDETPFDHGCNCGVCLSYRTEVRYAVQTGTVDSLSESMIEDARRLIRDRLGHQQRLTDVQGTED